MARPTQSIPGAADADAADPHGLTASGESPKPSARPGLVMSGKYRLISEIGRGGMGSVWRAEHLAWQAPVAIKVMTRDVTDHPDALARFEREVRLAAGLRSPHVVQVLDHGIDAATQTPFIAMELLEGESLARRLRRAGRLGPAETFQIISQLVRALSRAHGAGIVHRDLKPDNVFLVRNEDETIAKVLDFGIAKWTTPSIPKAGLTRPGSVLGTPFYMSPEQIQGSLEIDHRADLWSLAAITCECLTGRRPFEAADFAQLVLLLLTSTGRPLPSQLGPVPAGFDAWFLRATASNIDARFQSAREIAQTLAPICGVASSLAPESSPMGDDLGASREFPSMAPVSHTASRLFFPARLWRRPLARVALSTLVGVGITAGGFALYNRRALVIGGDTVNLPLTPATGGPRPMGEPSSPSAAAPSSPSTSRAPAETPVLPSSPGVRVVKDSALAKPDPASERIEEDSSVIVSNPKEGMEVDRSPEPAGKRRPASQRNAGAGRDKRPAKAPRSRAPKAVPAGTASESNGAAGRPDPDDPSSVNVNGRPIRTTL